MVFTKNPHLHLLTRLGRDVLLQAPGVPGGFDHLAKRAVKARVGEVQVALPALADLVRMEEAVGRPKDLEDLVGLRAYLEQRGGELIRTSPLGTSSRRSVGASAGVCWSRVGSPEGERHAVPLGQGRFDRPHMETTGAGGRMGTSSSRTTVPISVQPRITPSAPCGCNRPVAASWASHDRGSIRPSTSSW